MFSSGRTLMRRSVRALMRRGDHVPARSELLALAGSGPERALDRLDLREAVVGEGLILEEPPDGGLVLHAVAGGHAATLGHFGEAVPAWLAIDSLDDPLGKVPVPAALRDLGSASDRRPEQETGEGQAGGVPLQA